MDSYIGPPLLYKGCFLKRCLTFNWKNIFHSSFSISCIVFSDL